MVRTVISFIVFLGALVRNLRHQGVNTVVSAETNLKIAVVLTFLGRRPHSSSSQMLNNTGSQRRQLRLRRSKIIWVVMLKEEEKEINRERVSEFLVPLFHYKYYIA